MGEETDPVRDQDPHKVNQETKERTGLKLTSPHSQADWGGVRRGMKRADVGFSPWAWPAQEQV